MRARVKGWLGRLGATAEERVVALVTALCVLLGLWLRARGFFYDMPAFWVDEATWAVMLMELPLTELLIRPPGFMAVSKVAAEIFGPSETALRALPWVAAVAANLFAPALARRLFAAPAARLLFVAVVTLHPSATSFAKEFKPYSVSFTLHLALVLLTLRYVSSRRASDLGWLLGLAVLGAAFAQDIVFVYPGVFLVAGYDALRHRRRHLLPIALGAGAILSALALQYILIWSKIPAEDADFWGNKYKVFYTGRKGSYFEWLLVRWQTIAAFPGYQMKFWDARWLSADGWEALQGIAIAVWLVLHAVGVASMIFYRRYREMLLVLLPIGVVWSFNLAGLWPFGAFRTNLFLIGYSAAIAGMALDRPPERFRAVVAVTPAALLVLIPLFFFEDGWGPTKRALTYTSRFPEMVVWLSKQHRERGTRPEVLLIDRRDCDLWRYYVDVNPKLSPLRPGLKKAFDVRCVANDKRLVAVTTKTLMTERHPVWVLFNVREKTKPAIAAAKLHADVLAKAAVPSHTAIGFTPRPRQPDAGKKP